MEPEHPCHSSVLVVSVSSRILMLFIVCLSWYGLKTIRIAIASSWLFFTSLLFLCESPTVLYDCVGVISTTDCPSSSSVWKTEYSLKPSLSLSVHAYHCITRGWNWQVLCLISLFFKRCFSSILCLIENCHFPFLYSTWLWVCSPCGCWWRERENGQLLPHIRSHLH